MDENLKQRQGSNGEESADQMQGKTRRTLASEERQPTMVHNTVDGGGIPDQEVNITPWPTKMERLIVTKPRGNVKKMPQTTQNLHYCLLVLIDYVVASSTLVEH